MALSVGSRLGPYEILGQAGAGGMGEVYRARDTRLNRTVAIKVIPAEFSHSADLKQRLEREARAVSSLQHPNICVLHDIGHDQGVDYLVMEYLEGETLSQRLRKGALPLPQLVSIGVEIAKGLAKAHEQGIVHRDLKPGNIMLTRSGAKLMDFGLAKAAPKTAALQTNAATVSMPLTAQTTLVGTFQYMSPEQVAGTEVDARSDIFSFGAVLYEMATGKRAFEGQTQISVLSAILEKDPPPVSRENPLTPAALDRVVRRALAKDPELRWQNARDVGFELEALLEPAPATALQRSPQRMWKVITIAALALSLGLAILLVRPHRATPAHTTSFTLAPPERTAFWFNDIPHSMAVSPDGETLAFITSSAGPSRIWIRPLRSLDPKPLPGTEGAMNVFWSPDSRTIGFFSGNKLKKISIAGGAPEFLADAPPYANSGTWSRDGIILFTADTREQVTCIFRVPASGGATQQVLCPDRANQDFYTFWPSFLPDGDHFLYTVGRQPRHESAIWVASLKTGARKKLEQTSPSRALYSNGYLLQVKDGVLLAQTFDPGKLQLSGEPIVVAEDLSYFQPTGNAEFSVSDNGVLTYRTGWPLQAMSWLDRGGRQLETIRQPDRFEAVRLSRDGRRIAVGIANFGADDIWLFERGRQTPTRFTHEPSTEFAPVWSPNGQTIAFAADRHAPPNLHVKSLTDRDDGHRLKPPSYGVETPYDWSPDGKFIIFGNQGAATGEDLWLLALNDPEHPKPWLQGPGDETFARFSPDGKWIAYVSDESGRNEIYVMPFSGGEKVRISTSGGTRPAWRADGKELFFMSPDQELMAATVTIQPQLSAAAPKPLFRIDNRLWTEFDAAPDGQSFVVLVEDAANQPRMNVTTDWTSRLAVASK